MKTVEQRYMEDPEFHALVNNFRKIIEDCKFTPSEIREAAMLAQIQTERVNPRVTRLNPELEREIRHRMGQ